MTNQICLTSTIAHRKALTAVPSISSDHRESMDDLVKYLTSIYTLSIVTNYT
jgi:hypothetical protein